eukprot:TRINITY_DN3243_c0_g3_i2.p2 TRINITY_DN3243_c0_g3~~TRINITY_DN3243_c0_g3_i2.p2  ORF type:complete len:74 (+),score=21.78 TRINITY_DN3243_c0_g3_i2:172-393(+)
MKAKEEEWMNKNQELFNQVDNFMEDKRNWMNKNQELANQVDHLTTQLNDLMNNNDNDRSSANRKQILGAVEKS